MHGPGPTSPTNPLGWEPTYTQPIAVLDSVSEAVQRRKAWQLARDRALGMWEQAGLTFELTVGEPVHWTGPQPWTESLPGYHIKPHLVPNTIRLAWQVQDGTYRPSFGWYDADINGGIAVLLLYPGVFRRHKRRALAAHTAHEMGHCLGLWHRSKGIMGGAWQPDEHDLDAVKEWFT